MAECRAALRGDKVLCLTHNQRYAGCVLDERDKLRAEVGSLGVEGEKDYDGMREFQAKFIEADHKWRDLEPQITKFRVEVERLKRQFLRDWAAITETQKQLDEALEILKDWHKVECGCGGVSPCIHERTHLFVKKHSTKEPVIFDTDSPKSHEAMRILADGSKSMASSNHDAKVKTVPLLVTGKAGGQVISGEMVSKQKELSMPKFRKKPVVVEAFQWTGEDIRIEDPPWIWDKIKDGSLWYENKGLSGASLLIETLEGIMTARRGDWIIQGVNGEIYPCKPDIFEKTYEPVSE